MVEIAQSMQKYLATKKWKKNKEDLNGVNTLQHCHNKKTHLRTNMGESSSLE